MVQISQKELEKRYVDITCLDKRQRMPKDEKKIAKWAQYGKLKWSKNFPYEQIINPNLNSIEFWESHVSVPIESGTYRKIDSYTITLEQNGMASVSPTWKMVLEHCPAQYAIEGVGLYLNTLKFEKTTTVVKKSEEDCDDIVETKKTFTVWVMRRYVAGCKQFLSHLSDDQFGVYVFILNVNPDTFSNAISDIVYNVVPSPSSFEIRDEEIMDIHGVNFYFRIVREYLKREHPNRVEYCSFLNRAAVLKKIRTLKKDGKDVKELVELVHIMKRHPERFWQLRNID
ncbi:hypothetical protein KA405_02460 [Patescibacteria group bacterium]|nr:hypothetical protein [Patescibacteria group bacterium]